MNAYWPRLLSTVAISTAFALGCGSATEPTPPDENIIAPLGKDDDFFSNVAQEYLATATVEINLAATYADREQADRDTRARAIMEGKTKQIAWFLHVYLVDKSSHDEQKDYGGMRAMVLDGSFENAGLKADAEDPLKYTYTFQVEVGGSMQLLRKIREDNELEAGVSTFPLKMAKLANAKLTNFSHSAYGAGDWSPTSCDCELEELPLTFETIERSTDAYLDYKGYLDDGVMDISVHFGWDYHARYDITHSRAFYNWLVETMGFTSPVASYEQYSRISGALTKVLTINGKEVAAKITFYRPDPCVAWDEDGSGGDWDQKMEEDKDYKKRACDDWAWEDTKANANPTTDKGAGHLLTDLKTSLKTRDAIIFTGHSGYTYGYALASWYKTSAGDFDPPEIAKLDLPADKSQLFVISGCDTYHVGQAFKDNPNKAGLKNADVITTTSFSDAADLGDTKDVVRALVGDSTGKVGAYTYGRLLKKLNPSEWVPSYAFSSFTMYGVHGIDDNPTANPLGDAQKSCTSCQTDSDCGASGNVCVRLNTSERVCAVECVNDSGCGEGETCRKFGSGYSGALKGAACVPKLLTCDVGPPLQEKAFSAHGVVNRDQTKRYTVEVGTDARNIRVVLSGDNDADLYIRFNDEPTEDDYDCRPYINGSAETCEEAQSKGQTLQIMVVGFANAESQYQVKVDWE
jgi:hypothetical protein